MKIRMNNRVILKSRTGTRVRQAGCYRRKHDGARLARKRDARITKRNPRSWGTKQKLAGGFLIFNAK